MRARRDRDRAVVRVLWLVLVANFAVAALKLVIGSMVGAVALWADGLHSVLDGSSNIVGLAGMALATKPPDREHPYGHRRFETLAAAIIGFLIAGALSGIVVALVNKWTGAAPPPRPTWYAAAAVLVTLVVNIGVSAIEAKKGRELRSSLLTADAAHTASDAMASTVVLTSFAAAWLGWHWADSIAALVVSVLIARTAWRVLRSNLGVLIDRAPLDASRVHDAVMSVEGVLEAHDIRSRGLADHVHVDLCIHLDPETSLGQAHALRCEVRRAIERAFPEVVDVVIAVEPDHHPE